MFHVEQLGMNMSEVKTSKSQRAASMNWREKKIADGYRWHSFFIPEDDVDQVKKLIKKLSKKHDDK